MNVATNIDYSNLKSITKTLKSNLRQKYNTLEKIASDVDRASTQVTGGGAASGGLGDLGDLMEIFFNQNTLQKRTGLNCNIIFKIFTKFIHISKFTIYLIITYYNISIITLHLIIEIF